MSDLKYLLEDMDLDEISTVNSGDNPGADILIYKSDCMHDGVEKGEKCEKCGEIVKMMPGPDTVHHEKPLDDEDFKYHKKLKRKKKLSVMKKSSDKALHRMAVIEKRRRFR